MIPYLFTEASSIAKGVYFFRFFLRTFEVKGKTPEKIEESQLEAYILARLSIARLYPNIFL